MPNFHLYPDFPLAHMRLYCILPYMEANFYHYSTSFSCETILSGGVENNDKLALFFAEVTKSVFGLRVEMDGFSGF